MGGDYERVHARAKCEQDNDETMLFGVVCVLRSVGLKRKLRSLVKVQNYVILLGDFFLLEKDALKLF